MKRLIPISLMLILLSCKKEKGSIQHNLQFSSNINDPVYYELTINGVSGKNISETYIVEGNTDIALQLLREGGGTASVDAGDSLWTRGAIIVDGKLVKAYSGYNDALLSYHIE